MVAAKTITFGTISAESRAIVPKPSRKRIDTVIASDLTLKKEIKTAILEDFNNLATTFEENLSSVKHTKMHSPKRSQ